MYVKQQLVVIIAGHPTTIMVLTTMYRGTFVQTRTNAPWQPFNKLETELKQQIVKQIWRMDNEKRVV